MYPLSSSPPSFATAIDGTTPFARVTIGIVAPAPEVESDELMLMLRGATESIRLGDETTTSLAIVDSDSCIRFDRGDRLKSSKVFFYRRLVFEKCVCRLLARGLLNATSSP